MNKISSHHSPGPLSGLRVVEFASIGPGPFAAMTLADMGAEVIRVDRFSDEAPHPHDYTLRNRRSIAVNLKEPEAIKITLRLLETADALIEGFRPGVMERLGLSPKTCQARNPRLVYGRMTGWGQTGPWAKAAGHDLNYIALTGALWATGEASRKPTFAMNLLGDYGGGGMYLALGLVSAILKAQKTGQGDIVDAAICDGANHLMSFIHSRRAMGAWQDEREANHLDGGRPWYNVYQCEDDKWISIAAIEPQFWECLLKLLGVSAKSVGPRDEPSTFAATRTLLTDIFASQPRSHWDRLLGGTDACYAPVLSPREARFHPHMAERRAFFDETPEEPRPAPRFSTINGDSNTTSEGAAQRPPVPRRSGQDTQYILSDLGYKQNEIDAWNAKGVVLSSSCKKQKG